MLELSFIFKKFKFKTQVQTHLNLRAGRKEGGKRRGGIQFFVVLVQNQPKKGT